MVETNESIIIVLPLPARVLQPNCTIGSFGSRMMKASATKRYRRLAREAIDDERIETAPWKKVEVHVAYYFATNRKRDQDNAMGALKAAYDGIVDSGLVPDDDYEHMKRTSPTFGIDEKSPRVELTIARKDK